MKAKNLSSQLIDKIWTYADVMAGQNPEFIRQDCLGAEIHKSDYEKDTLYGWCAEYVISPNQLKDLGCSLDNILEEANIRILNIANFEKNLNHKIGQYAIYVRNENETNHYQSIREISVINQAGITELQRIFNLSDDQIKEIF